MNKAITIKELDQITRENNYRNDNELLLSENIEKINKILINNWWRLNNDITEVTIVIDFSLSDKAFEFVKQKFAENGITLQYKNYKNELKFKKT